VAVLAHQARVVRVRAVPGDVTGEASRRSNRWPEVGRVATEAAHALIWVPGRPRCPNGRSPPLWRIGSPCSTEGKRRTLPSEGEAATRGGQHIDIGVVAYAAGEPRSHHSSVRPGNSSPVHPNAATIRARRNARHRSRIIAELNERFCVRGRARVHEDGSPGGHDGSEKSEVKNLDPMAADTPIRDPTRCAPDSWPLVWVRDMIGDRGSNWKWTTHFNCIYN
jgi:hypothetical protein